MKQLYKILGGPFDTHAWLSIVFRTTHFKCIELAERSDYCTKLRMWRVFFSDNDIIVPLSFYVGRMWGGKRNGAGRNRRKSDEKTDWNMYKKEAKTKKLKEAAKSTMNLKNFFSVEPQFRNRSGNAKEAEETVGEVKDAGFVGNVEEDRKTTEIMMHQNDTSLQIPSHLPFFVNGCKASGKIDFEWPSRNKTFLVF